MIILATVTESDGSSVNLQLPVASAALNWTAYSAKLYLPMNAVRVTLYYKLACVGYLEIDDAGLLPTTTLPLKRGLISITIDDSWSTDYTNALPILTQHAAPATHYVLTGDVGTSNALSLDMLRALQAHGDEIASHTVHHYDLTTLSAADLETELASSRQFLESNGFGPVLDFASPYGAYDATVLAAIQRNYQSHRTVDVGYNAKDDFDPYRLKVQNVFSTTTVSEVDSWAAQAAADRSWLILVYHSIADPPQEGIDSTTPAKLEAQLSALQSHGLPFVTLRQALDEIVPQVTLP
jgi:Predicted xylanase/chitin deacetylase